MDQGGFDMLSLLSSFPIFILVGFTSYEEFNIQDGGAAPTFLFQGASLC